MEEKVIKEVIEMIKNNIELLLKYNDKTFLGTKRYIKEHKKEKEISNIDLIYLTEEALAELINVEYLYDLRTIE